MFNDYSIHCSLTTINGNAINKIDPRLDFFILYKLVSQVHKVINATHISIILYPISNYIIIILY